MKKPWWDPTNYQKKTENLRIRAGIYRTIRDYFQGDGFVEVETPILQVSPGLEPHLHAFSTQLIRPDRKEQSRYLHTSPEFTMKKLLVAGESRIFQFARCFRNQERSNTHHPEFTMLEWYRAGVDYEVIMQDCEHILQRVGRLAQGHSFTWNGLKCSAENGVEKISVAEAFHRYTATDLLHTITDPDSPRPDLLRVEAERMNIRCREDDSWEDIFFRIFLEKIEPKLGIGKPTILYDYPVAMAALSRPKPSNPNLAERFEIYICGLELANAFSELTDPVVQAKRFRIDMDKKFHLYGERYPIDQEFLQALELGMPDSAGIALGVDRLAMLTAGTDQLDNVLWAPVDDWSETNRA